MIQSYVTRIAFILIPVFMLSMQSVTAQAQNLDPTHGTTSPGVRPGSPAGAYELSDFETINPYNGSLNFRLTLAQVGGRTGAPQSIILPIQRRWIATRTAEPNPGCPECYRDGVQDVSDDYPQYLGVKVSVKNTARQAFATTCHCIGQLCDFAPWVESLSRIYVTMPDGTEYEMRDQATGGRPFLTFTCDLTQEPSRGNVFVTADGSSATFIADSPIIDRLGSYVWEQNGGQLEGSVSGVLKLKDGTTYRVSDGRPVEIVDRNGNKIRLTQGPSHDPNAAIDPLNRQVQIERWIQDVAPYGFCDRITYKGFAGETRAIRVSRANLGSVLRPGYTLQTYQQLFSEFFFLNGITSLYNPERLVSAVWLPDGRRYQFFYNPYGELARVVLPTGAAIEYDWDRGLSNLSPGDWKFSGPNGGFAVSAGDGYHIYRRVVERRYYPDGGSAGAYASRTTYSRPESLIDDYPHIPTTGYVDVIRLAPSGEVLAHTRHYYINGDFGSEGYIGGAALSLTDHDPLSYANWREGKEYQTESLNASGQVLRRAQYTWQAGCAVSSFSNFRGENNHRIAEVVTTLVDSNQVSKQSFSYDCYNNVTDVYSNDFGAGVPGPLIMRTHTSYLTTNPNQGGVNYATDYNIHIRNLPTQKTAYDASENLMAQTDYVYDHYVPPYSLVDCPDIVQHDSGFHTGYGARGNLTEVIYFNPGGSPSEVHLYNQYDIAGNLVKAVDGRGFPTHYDFSDCFGSPDNEARSNSGAPELAGGFSYAFVTKVTDALENAAYSQYDYYLGKVVNTEGTNGIISSVTYDDALDRPTQSIQSRYKVGVGALAEKRQTTTIYDDANHVITTTGDRDTFNDNILAGKVYYDGLGRKVRGAAREGSTWSITDTLFDGLGRVSQVSNPYRASDPGAASPPAGLWTKTDYDTLGRVIRMTTPDGAYADTDYNGNRVTVVDQAGKRRRSETDALGRLIRVIEDPGGLNYETYYSYDALGNLLLVTQGAQNRTFTYDSLSRLISATNPESGPVSYAYDANGNLTDKTDPRGVITTITYDKLNRAISKVYTGTTTEGTAAANATPKVNYFYDDYSALPSGAPSWPGTPSKGMLIGVTYGTGSEGTYYKYDAAGRIVINHQRQGNSSYATNYTYNLAGGVTREQRGNYVNNVWKEYFRNSWTYDNAGRFSGMEASFTPFISSVPLVREISYTPFGGLQSEKYGNGLIHSMGYNNRQQPTEVRLGRPDNLESVFTIYSMHGTANNVNGQDAEISLAQNNGNIARIKYSVSGAIKYTQTFQYDPLNRLRYAVEHNNAVYNDGARAWYQTFDYDLYGNRGINVENTSDNADAANNALQLADFSAANNRITRSGYDYDAAGNLIAEPGKSYTYNAENRIVTATVSGVGTSQYFYDGNGRRVKKVVGGVGTRFEYGAGGELIAERNDSNGVVTKGYCYKGGALVATTTTGTTYEYATDDQLGSPRAWTDNSGNLVAGGRHDYLPFGEELFAGYGTRTTDQGYAASAQQDGQRKQFTGQERDTETGLDYFGARYMASVQGRFTSVDPSRASIQLTNPQSFNRYAYAYNNPMVYIDHNGKWPTWIHHLIIDRAFPGLSNRSRNQIKRGSDYVDRFPGGQTTGSSYQHGMTAPGQPVAEAARLAEEFIQANQAEAQRQIRVGESVKGKFGGVNVCWDTTDNYICRAGDGAFSGGVKNSLYFFGMAYHTVSDMTSPAHVGFQMWRGIWIFEGTGLVLGGALSHMNKESAIDSYQLGYAIGVTLELFLNTYGPAEYARATNGLVFGSNSDPSVKAIEDKYKLPGAADPAKEAEELYLYRNGVTNGRNDKRKRQ